MCEMLVSLFKMDHPDNMRILKALIYSKDDKLPLLDGSNKKRVCRKDLLSNSIVSSLYQSIVDSDLLLFTQTG